MLRCLNAPRRAQELYRPCIFHILPPGALPSRKCPSVRPHKNLRGSRAENFRWFPGCFQPLSIIAEVAVSSCETAGPHVRGGGIAAAPPGSFHE